jgi:hypothetical protein
MDRPALKRPGEPRMTNTLDAGGVVKTVVPGTDEHDIGNARKD